LKNLVGKSEGGGGTSKTS